MENNKNINFSLIAIIGVVILLFVGGCVLIDPKADNLPNIYGGRSSYYISKNKKLIYYESTSPLGTSWIKIREANPKTFVVFNSWWAKDDKYLYESSNIKSDIYHSDINKYSYNFYTGKIDIESFHVDEQGIIKDKNHVYHDAASNLILIEHADVNTYEPIARNRLAKDEKHYFFFEETLPIEDYDSFVFLNTDNTPTYGKDKYQVYLFKKDPFTYLRTKIIENANPETFEFIEIYTGSTDINWSKDDKHYYYLGEQHAIDYDSFQVLYNGLVIDKNQVYRYGKIIDKTVEEAKAEAEEKYKRDNPDME